MPDEIREKDFYYQIPDFALGLQTYLPNQKKPLNSLVECQNALVLDSGVIRKRAGFRSMFTHTTATSTWRPTAFAVAGFGNQKKLYLGLRSTLNVLWQALTWDGTLKTELNLAAASADLWQNGMAFVKQGPSASVSPSQYVVFWSTGIGAVERISVTNAGVPPTLIGSLGDTNASPPLALAMVVDPYNRLWAADTQIKLREGVINYSFIGEPDRFDRAAFAFDFYTGTKNPQRAVALEMFKDNFVLVGQTSQIMLIGFGSSSSLSDFSISTVARDLGIGSPKSIGLVGDDLVFCDQEGQIRTLQILLTTSGASVNRRPMSYPILDRIADQIDKALVLRSNGCFHDGRYWYSFVDTTGTFHTYVLDWNTQTWSGPMKIRNGLENYRLYPTHKLSFVGDVPGGSGGSGSQFYLYCSSPDDASTLHVIRHDDALLVDHSAAGDKAIEMILQTKAFDFDLPHQEKVLKWAEFEFRRAAGSGTGEFKVEGRADFGDWVVVHPNVRFNSSNIAREKVNLRALGKGTHFDFRITDVSTAARLELQRMWISGQTFNPRDN